MHKDKLYYYYDHFGGHWENKPGKMITKQSEEYFFHQRCKKTATNTEMASRFRLAAYIIRLFDFIGLFSLVEFSILARKMRHNARQSDNNRK